MINVTNIERFALHDGPGIRTTVFLKGCSLFCPWCANPETQTSKPELFYDQKRCISCQTCAQVCHEKAITFEADNRFHFHKEKCTFCFQCQEACTQQAIDFVGEQKEIKDVLAEVMKDKTYYDVSNGGITISGGEPLVQKDALLCLLKEAKQLGLHTAIETTLSYSLATLQEVEPYIDMFLCDFKHMDDIQLKTICGGNNTHVKTNLAYLLNKYEERVEVRIPIIPFFNHDEETIQAMLLYLKKIKAKHVALLAYHTLGKNKYDKMAKTYMQQGKMLDKKDLLAYKAFGESIGLQMKIGG